MRGMFPQTATSGRYGDREYYDAMPQRPTHTEEGQLRFENGDITYCPSNNTIVIFYAKADDPDMGQLTMRIIPRWIKRKVKLFVAKKSAQNTINKHINAK